MTEKVTVEVRHCHQGKRKFTTVCCHVRVPNIILFSLDMCLMLLQVLKFDVCCRKSALYLSFSSCDSSRIIHEVVRRTLNDWTSVPSSLIPRVVMAAPVISISSDVSVESVGSSFPRVILIGSISVEVPVAPEVGAAAVASPAGVLELDTHSSSKADPSESSPPPVSVAPMVSPFLCSDDFKQITKITPEMHYQPTPYEAMITRWRSRVASRSSSPTTSIGIWRGYLPISHTILIPFYPPHLLLFASIILGSNYTWYFPQPRFRATMRYLIRPGRDNPIGRLYRTHPGGPCKALTVKKSVRPLSSHRLVLRYSSHNLDHFTSRSSSSHSSSNHSSSGHSISGHSLSRHTPPDTTDADSSTPLRFVHLSLTVYRGLSPLEVCPIIYYVSPRQHNGIVSWGFYLSTSFPSTSSNIARGLGIYFTRGKVLLRTLMTDVLEDIEADATADEVVVDMDVKAGVDAGIGMEVDVGVEVEDEVKEEVESSDRGTIEVGVDVVAGIDIPDGMLMPDVVERLEQYAGVCPLQRIKDIKMGQRELEALDHVASLERSNARLQGTMMMERAERPDRLW
ncbi:hypothetical protein Tco_0908865 [Tanacetum coccineum]|uniref:Uncharacterized protein n=1 Tax=Tanacetum coccineum TaxID=301880 RepID=A0ABQ5CNC8_9ASTR